MRAVCNKILHTCSSLAIATFMLVHSESVSADAVHLFSGGFPASTIQNLTYYKDPSLTTYTYADEVDKAAPSWNGISSKVKLTNGASTAKVKVYAGNYSTQTWNGIMDPYSGGTYDPEGDDIWDSARIRLNYYQMTTQKSLNSLSIQSVAGHEFGHALSLKHTGRSVSIMTDDYYDDFSYYLPQTMDKDHLKLKWGY